MGTQQSHELDEHEESKGKRLHIMVTEQLKHETKFDSHQLDDMYKHFAVENPKEIIEKDKFILHNIKFTNFGSEEFWGHVFDLFDQDGNGEITFVEWAVLLSLLQKGTIQEKIRWLFHVFDTDNSGYLSAEELEFIFSLIVAFYPQACDGKTPAEFVKHLCETLDTDHDDKLSLREFAIGISKFPILYDTFVILSDLVAGKIEVVFDETPLRESTDEKGKEESKAEDGRLSPSGAGPTRLTTSVKKKGRSKSHCRLKINQEPHSQRSTSPRHEPATRSNSTQSMQTRPQSPGLMVPNSNIAPGGGFVSSPSLVKRKLSPAPTRTVAEQVRIQISPPPARPEESGEKGEASEQKD